MRGFGLIGVVLALLIVVVSANRQRTVMVPATATGSGVMIGRDVAGERMQQGIRHAVDAAVRASNPDTDAP